MAILGGALYAPEKFLFYIYIYIDLTQAKPLLKVAVILDKLLVAVAIYH